MTEAVRVRFAPSPTGYFHVGGARTALYNYLFAQHHGGRFILRIEDTDRTRYQHDALPDHLEGLRWLGLWWDEGPEIGGSYGPYFQSDRLAIYREQADNLVHQGLAYRCYCSAERLAEMRRQQRASGAPVGYDRRCRYLDQQQIADHEAQGIVPVVRLAAPTEGVTAFDDVLRGHISVANQQLDDLVLEKSDGFPTYHLANVIDDHLMGITHIMRGDEWLSSMPKHVLLYNAFGWEMPVQVHLPTILDPSGKGKLSKRKKRLPDGRQMLTFVHEFRQAGYLPEAMVNYLALVGWSYDDKTEFLGRDELIRYFELAKVSRSPGAFSYDKLDHMNGAHIRALGENDLAGRLMSVYRANGLSPSISTVVAIVPLIQERLKTLNDAIPLTDLFFQDEITYDSALLIQRKMDGESTQRALSAAENALASLSRFDEETLEEALRTLASELGLKAGPLFGTIRVACTGKKVAPPLFGTLAILGQDLVVKRLREAIQLLEQGAKGAA